jgi:hypothetical protein
MKTNIQTRSISSEIQKTVWDQVLSYQGKDRPFCRDHDGITSYDEPKIRQFVKKDWRFNR